MAQGIGHEHAANTLPPDVTTPTAPARLAVAALKVTAAGATAE